MFLVPAGGLADPSSAVVALGEVRFEDLSFAEVAFVVVQGGHAVGWGVAWASNAFDGFFDLGEFAAAHALARSLLS